VPAGGTPTSGGPGAKAKRGAADADNQAEGQGDGGRHNAKPGAAVESGLAAADAWVLSDTPLYPTARSRSEDPDEDRERDKDEEDEDDDLDQDDEEEEEDADEDDEDEDDWDQDDEDGDDEDYGAPARPQSSRPVVKVASELQSQRGRSRKGVFIPDWALAIVAADAEQKLLGFIDYWLGITTGRGRRGESGKHHRATGKYLRVDDDGMAWYVATYREIGWRTGQGKEKVRWYIRRLRKRGFVVTERVTRKDASTAMALRLDWERIERAYAEAAPPWQRADDDG
jgi:hypothetical protein